MIDEENLMLDILSNEGLNVCKYSNKSMVILHSFKKYRNIIIYHVLRLTFTPSSTPCTRLSFFNSS